jgi:hypothetical protein
MHKNIKAIPFDILMVSESINSGPTAIKQAIEANTQ